MTKPKDYTPFVTFAAAAYGFDPGILDRVAVLESNRNPNAVNNWDSNAKAGHRSEGIVQFIKPTFDAYARHARKANPQAWKGIKADWRDWRAQLLAASWAMKNGHGSAWATWDRAQSAAKGRLPRISRPWGGTSALGSTGSVGKVPGAPNGAQNASHGPTFTMSQRAALEMVFDSSPFLKNLISAIPQTSTPPPAPVRRVAKVVAKKVQNEGPKAAPKMRAGEEGWQYLQRLGRMFGLQNDPGNSQTTGGRHTAGSEHYDGRAIDFGDARNSRKALNAWRRWASRHGFDVLDEGDHIHVSLPGSGT